MVVVEEESKRFGVVLRCSAGTRKENQFAHIRLVELLICISNIEQSGGSFLQEHSNLVRSLLLFVLKVINKLLLDTIKESCENVQRTHA